MDARLTFGTHNLPPLRAVNRDADALIASHHGLVRKLAWHVHSRVSSAIDVEDLIQIGTISLIAAARGAGVELGGLRGMLTSARGGRV